MQQNADRAYPGIGNESRALSTVYCREVIADCDAVTLLLISVSQILFRMQWKLLGTYYSVVTS